MKETILQRAHQKPSNFIHSFPNLHQIAAAVCLHVIYLTKRRNRYQKFLRLSRETIKGGGGGGGEGDTRLREDDFQPEWKLRTHLRRGSRGSGLPSAFFGMIRPGVIRGMRRASGWHSVAARECGERLSFRG